MKKDVLVIVTGMQISMDNPDGEEIEIITPGQYFEKNGKKYITYKETEISGSEGTTDTIKIEDNKVTVMRHGTNSSHMIFQLGKKHMTHYNTPFGTLLLGMTTTSIHINMKEERGDIEVKYNLEVNHVLMGSNTLYIKIASDRNEISKILREQPNDTQPQL